MHAVAADDRAGTGRRASLHRSRDDRRRGACVGLLQSAGGGGFALVRCASLRPHACGGSDVRARNDKKAHAPRMGDGSRCGDRSRSRSEGDLHADEGFPSRLRRIRGQTKTQVRRQLSGTRMNVDHLDWPFFDNAHHTLATGLGIWVAAELSEPAHVNVDAACRDLVRRLGDAGWLRYCVPAAYGGELPALDSRALCIARETLAYADGLADFVFAMQGLGSGPITLAGTPAQKGRWLPAVAKGKTIAAFALSEPEAGSDVGAMTTTARRDGDSWLIDGVKTWISNGGIADFYCVFARAAGTSGTRGISSFIVPAAAPGLAVAER